ncbi:hypothetical protein FJZ19_04220 [Candidatus Pacearchaeota archaeon]|nr:hypothetical protein [Candidatus Pacearchaeota archaeon]
MMLDIFSGKKEEKSEEKPIVVADIHEKNSLVISELFSLGIQVKFEKLDVADFLINSVAVERKTISDFLSSMISKRLSQQLENLGQYEKRFLIIEGIDEQNLYTEKEKGINSNAVRGFLLDIILKYQIPIIFSKNYEDTARFLDILARKPDKTSSSLRMKRKTLNKKEQMQFILEGFPGIGAETAKKLLSRFKTIKNIINSEELEKEIGKKAGAFKLVDEEY